MAGRVDWIGPEEAQTIEALGSVGFSHKLIAEIALGIDRKERSAYARRARNAVAQHLSRRRILLRDWRDGYLPSAMRFALARAGYKPRAKRRKRRKAG